MISRRASRVFAFVAALGCAGCSSGPVNGVVQGRVTIGGVPLAGVTVALDDPATKFGVMVKTDANGGYQVKSYKDAGLPPATYRVAVRPRRELESGEDQAGMLANAYAKNKVPLEPNAQKEKQADIPAKYHDSATSGLQITVVPGSNPPFDFELTRGGR